MDSSLIITQRGKVSYQGIESLLSQESPVKDPESPLDGIENGRLDYAIDRFAFEDEETLRDIHLVSKEDKPWAWLGKLVQEKQL